MITAEDFKRKIFAQKGIVNIVAANLVEEKLSKILPDGKINNSFSIDYSYMNDYKIIEYINFCNRLVKELEKRGFVNVDYGFSEHTIDFYFDVDLIN